MSYAALPESLRLIAGAPVAGAERLTRRRRFLPVAVDVDDDIAVTVFLRRTHGGAEWQSHVLLRTRGEWQLLGGGGWGPDDLDVLTRVPTAAELGGPASANGAGGVAVGRPGPSEGWLSYAMIATTTEVDHVSIAGRPPVHRPEHGYIAVVWRGESRLRATAMRSDGHPLGTVDLHA